MGRRQGRFIRINKHSPDGIGVCDYSGFTFNYKDLHRQLEWRGDRLAWTGFLVSGRHLDKPNPQLRPPPTPLDDPRPIRNARTSEIFPSENINPIDLRTARDNLNNFNWSKDVL